MTTENRSEATFSILANSLPMVTWVADREQGLPFINDEWFEFVGRSRDDEDALVWQNFLHPDDVDETLEIWRDAIDNEIEFSAETRVRRHDGVYRWFRLQSVPREQDGRVVWFGSGIDIHETVMLRMEALRSLTRYQRTIDSIRDAFFTLDSSNRCTIANERFLELVGLEREQLEQVDVLAALPASAREKLVELIAEASRNRQPQTEHVRVAEIDREFSLRVFPGTDEFTVYLTDITEEARAQRELNRSEERFRLLAQASSELVWELDMTTGEIWTSADSREMFDPSLAPEENKSSSWLELAHPDDRGEVDRSFKQALADGQPTWSRRFRVPAGDQMKHFRTKAAFVYDEDGRPLRAIGGTADISDQVLLEQHILRAQRTETVGRLAGGVAHDLNNVLAPILVTASLLKEMGASPEYREDLELIESSALRGSRMINRLLAFARGTDSQVEVIDTRELVIEVLKLLRETLPKSIVFETELPRELYVEGDETQLHQVITNLVVNARDAMPTGGTLTIESRVEKLPEAGAQNTSERLAGGSYIVIEVADTGEGIPEDQLDAVFDPYFTTKEIGKGTGLGLSTSLGIIQRHNGLLFVDSKVGEGTSFKVYLPRAVVEHSIEETSGVIEEHARSPMSDAAVLLVDDEPAILQSVERLLVAAGYRVATASDGAEGLAAFKNSEFNLVITDVMMPTMSGDLMVAAIAELDTDTPILAWSGRVEGGRRASLDQHIDGFIDKPFSADQLLDEVARLLTR